LLTLSWNVSSVNKCKPLAFGLHGTWGKWGKRSHHLNGGYGYGGGGGWGGWGCNWGGKWGRGCGHYSGAKKHGGYTTKPSVYSHTFTAGAYTESCPDLR
jgi:hypothetical protein